VQDGGTQIFVLRQDGNELTGVLEGAGGSGAPAPITDGQVDGTNVSFKAGNSTFSGRIKKDTTGGDTIELERAPNSGTRPPRPAAQPEASGPAVGPPPDGSDPSRSPLYRPPGPVQIALHRVER
jgi:beta-galactosidase